MADEISKPTDSWVTRFVRDAKTAVVKATPQPIKTYGGQAGSTAVEIGEGLLLGGLIGAARARFGVDAAPAVLGMSALASVALAGTPDAARYARSAAGIAAGIMADRKVEALVAGKAALSAIAGGGNIRTVGGGAPSAALHGDTSADLEDPVVRTAEKIEAARRARGGQ